MGLRPLEISLWIKSDVQRRQILTSKLDPSTVIVKDVIVQHVIWLCTDYRKNIVYTLVHNDFVSL